MQAIQPDHHRKSFMFQNAYQLLIPSAISDSEAETMLNEVGFTDWKAAHKRLQNLTNTPETRELFSKTLPVLLFALRTAASPDVSLVNFERFIHSEADAARIFQYLIDNPRAVEILIKLFVGSQFLTEILLRNPSYLEKLTAHKRLAEFKSRQDFFSESEAEIASCSTPEEKLDALRRFQKWELLRLGACDSFRLMDFKTVTVELSLLADSLVQQCLKLFADQLKLSLDNFVVLAFGKLGGEEINYSSDIDLVFLTRIDSMKYWPLGQKLIKALTHATSEGFMYRVDMRLRPWGKSGALVNTIDAHTTYLKKHGMIWELQALLKARPIAGNEELGMEFLQKIRPLMFHSSREVLRENVKDMKAKIEEKLKKQGKEELAVKAGPGCIRDIEFVTQYLQLAYGNEHPNVVCVGTLDALNRLGEYGLIQANEYRQLTSAYVFLRRVEHSLQLTHLTAAHSLPASRRELSYFARRLDFPDADLFLDFYNKHRLEVRSIFEKYILETEPDDEETEPLHLTPLDLEFTSSVPSYKETFPADRIQLHESLRNKLTPDHCVHLHVQPIEDERIELTLVGYDAPGVLSIMCGLLFVHGFNILDGNAFSDGHVLNKVDKQSSSRRGKQKGCFINVFMVEPPGGRDPKDAWTRYADDLVKLVAMVLAGKYEDAQGELALKVGARLRRVKKSSHVLYPVEIEIDNEMSKKHTVLKIQSADTIGFLYELSNALTFSGIDTRRVIVATDHNQVSDILFVTDQEGKKVTDEDQLKELRATIVLIKHFTHLLPESSNPEKALRRFREFLRKRRSQSNWVQELSSLQKSDVLQALARVLGVGDFLWEDFLKIQHENLFPVVAETEILRQRKSKAKLQEELNLVLEGTLEKGEQITRLNTFKDREMFRIDMRHIQGYCNKFGRFAEEITDLAEVIVAAALNIAQQRMNRKYGRPLRSDGEECKLSVCALGKCGGREMGYASDVELMFLYDKKGKTDGEKSIWTSEYFPRLVTLFKELIETKRSGIFEVDLRLRPYGNAGALAVTLETFEEYFQPSGPAWPYERQALVKLRPIAGDEAFGQQVVSKRDELIYRGEPFDTVAMRAMRDRQHTQLVRGGSFNVKLSLGGLVDVEYLVQGLQITHGHRDSSLRATPTLRAMKALAAANILADEDYQRLRSAFVFQRKLIDALRMVRGHAKDLTLPIEDPKALHYITRRVDYAGNAEEYLEEIEQHVATVKEMSERYLPS